MLVYLRMLHVRIWSHIDSLESITSTPYKQEYSASHIVADEVNRSGSG